MEIIQPSWRGKNISTRKDSQGKYTAMIGGASMLYIPVSVAQNAIYRITLDMAKKSGNGLVYCNIYGNKNFDFPHAKFICDSNEWASYTLELRTGSFPKTVPMIFRIWRSPNGTGSLLVRRIRVELISPDTKNELLPEMPNAAKGLTPVIKEKIAPVEKPKTVQPPREFPDREEKRKRRERNRPKGKESAKSKPRPLTSNIIKTVRSAPDIGPLVPGEDGIKNSVIISLKDRLEFLDRTLYTYAKQTMPKDQFEIVIIDDGSKDNILGLCKTHAARSGLQFQYIRVDTKKGAVPQKGFTPALTNNIGFKNARGSVVIITGPETLQMETNMSETWDACQGPLAIYGYVYKSGPRFVDAMKSNKEWHKYDSFEEVLSLPAARESKPDLAGFWWYYAAIRKEYVLKIHGVDEKYMEGICGEDDDFANRLSFLGLELKHNKKIVGIHQNHSREDKKDTVHNIRFDKQLWRKMRNHNLRLLEACKNVCDPIANKNIDWGTEEAIIDKEIF